MRVRRIFSARGSIVVSNLRSSFAAKMAATSILAALRTIATHCHVAAWSFTDEQAAEGLVVADRLRDLFLPPPAATASAVPQPPLLHWLQLLPSELLSVVLSYLDTHDLARFAATCRPLWRDAPTPPPRPMPLLRPMGPVETELRRRVTARGLRIGSSLPKGALSWVPYLLRRVLCDMLRQTPLAAGHGFSVFLDAEGRLLTCGSENTQERRQLLLGHDWGTDVDPDEPRSIGPPTLVPSMQGRRIVSVAASDRHCLALSREGEVYSWGDGSDGSLGHTDGGDRAVPSRIESLSRIEIIAAGDNCASAAVDEDGRLFTWGQAINPNDTTMPSGLGYAQTESQLTPKWVEALSEDRVVGIALGFAWTLVVTDAGAVFSFGDGEGGVLGHGSLEAEVLPRRIEALAQTGRRFVAVAAGDLHALALTEEGDLYGWGDEDGNGDGRGEPIPHLVAAFGGQRVKHVYASTLSSCAVTEKGELFTWGWGEHGDLGHGDKERQLTPKRVEGLRGVQVAVAAMCHTHTLVADEDGVVWAFGGRSALGLDVADADADENVQDDVLEPAPISTLRVRARNSPDVLPFR